MIRFSRKFRSQQEEIMDDFKLSGPELQVLLNDLQRVNRLLGGNGTTTSGLSRLWPKDKDELVLLDVGCGDGAQLRHCVDWAKKQGRSVRGIGLDANPNIIDQARKRSVDYPGLDFQIFDVFSDQHAIPDFDIGLCTLFLHHFQNDVIIALLDRIMRNATLGVIVNDLQRHPLAFWAFRLFVAPMLNSPIARHDGAVSVARSFTRNDLHGLSQNISSNDQIHWRWAFRWQWILQPQTIN